MAIGTPPSMKVTVPVVMPEPRPVTCTVAVMATGCPVTDGFNDDASDVDVVAGSMVWVSAGDVEAAKLASPV